jgi:hypothetical protein
MVVTLHFLVDFDGELKHLSLAFQKRNVTISDVIDGLERATRHLTRMLQEDGTSLKEFHAEFEPTAETYKGFQLQEVEEGKKEFAADRKLLITTALAYLQERFAVFVKDPVMQSARTFEHRRWSILPANELESWGIDDVKYLYEYLQPMLPRDCCLANCLFEWARLKSNITKYEKQLFALGNTDFWLHMISKYSDPMRC